MAVQNAANISTVPFIRSGNSYVKNGQTLLTDGGRAIPLAPFTVMAKVAASQKWVPLTTVTAADGGAVAQGIYVGDSIPAADIVAGDVEGLSILVGGACTVDENQVVLENSLTLEDVFEPSDATATYYVVTVRDLLAQRGIFIESTVDIDGFENA